MIPVYTVNSEFPLEAIFSLPLTVPNNGWTTSNCHQKVRFVIAVSDVFLFFGAKVLGAPWHDNYPSGQWVENLWQKDVLELFIADDNTSAYQEFNLSPSGAWWSGLFAESRVNDLRNFNPLTGVKTISQAAESSWQAALTIPRGELSVTTTLGSESRLNFSAIIGETQRQYLSWADLSGQKPDFHQRQEFERIRLFPG